MTKKEPRHLAHREPNELAREIRKYIDNNEDFTSERAGLPYIMGTANPDAPGTWKLKDGPAKHAIEQEVRHGKVDYIVRFLRYPLLWKAKGQAYFIPERVQRKFDTTGYLSIRETEETDK